MIICEECGAHNRNGAYVCAECGASLLHLEATEDDEAVPAKRRMPLFGRKRAIEEPEDEYGEPESTEETGPEDVEPEYDEGLTLEDEVSEDDVTAPARHRLSLFGRKGRPRIAEEPEHEDEEPESGEKRKDEDQIEPEPDEGIRFEYDKPEDEEKPGENKDESEREEFRLEEPDNAEKPEAEIMEPEAEEGLRFEFEEPESDTEPEADEPAEDSVYEYNEPDQGEGSHFQSQKTVHVRVARAKEDTVQALEDGVPSSITIDMDLDEFDAEPEEPEGNERMTRGMIAAIITVSSLLVVTLVVLGVLLIGKNSSAPVIATTAPASAAVTETIPVEAATPSAVPTPSQTPVPTTNAEEDYSSVFQTPAGSLITGTE